MRVDEISQNELIEDIMALLLKDNIFSSESRQVKRLIPGLKKMTHGGLDDLLSLLKGKYLKESSK